MLDYVALIPLFPAIGFAINLFFGRRMAKGAVGFIACAAIGLSFLVSPPGLHRPAQAPAGQPFGGKDPLHLDPFRRISGQHRFPGRSPLHRHDDGRLRGLLHHPHLLPWVHARRPGLSPLLHLSEPLRLLHAHPGLRQQFPAHVRGLGRGGALLLLPDRLLVREEIRLGRRARRLSSSTGSGTTASCWPSS